MVFWVDQQKNGDKNHEVSKLGLGDWIITKWFYSPCKLYIWTVHDSLYHHMSTKSHHMFYQITAL